MHNPESVLEYDIHELLWDFDKQMDHLISARRPDHIIIYKNKELAKLWTLLYGWPQSKIEKNEKLDKYLDLARELKETVENESDNYTNCNWCFWYSHRRIIKGTGRLDNNMTSGNRSNYYIIEIGQNTEKCPGNLRRLVIQTPVK